MRRLRRVASRSERECRHATSDRVPRSAGRAIACQDHDSGMNKFEIARVLDEISKYVELRESNRFKSLAFEQACKTGRVATLKGFGEKTQQKILEGIGYARKRESNFLLPIGIDIGEQIRERLADIDAVENAEVSGSVRRRLETIRNVNIVV